MLVSIAIHISDLQIHWLVSADITKKIVELKRTSDSNVQKEAYIFLFSYFLIFSFSHWTYFDKGMDYRLGRNFEDLS